MTHLYMGEAHELERRSAMHIDTLAAMHLILPDDRTIRMALDIEIMVHEAAKEIRRRYIDALIAVEAKYQLIVKDVLDVHARACGLR